MIIHSPTNYINQKSKNSTRYNSLYEYYVFVTEIVFVKTKCVRTFPLTPIYSYLRCLNPLHVNSYHKLFEGHEQWLTSVAASIRSISSWLRIDRVICAQWKCCQYVDDWLRVCRRKLNHATVHFLIELLWLM